MYGAIWIGDVGKNKISLPNLHYIQEGFNLSIENLSRNYIREGTITKYLCLLGILFHISMALEKPEEDINQVRESLLQELHDADQGPDGYGVRIYILRQLYELENPNREPVGQRNSHLNQRQVDGNQQGSQVK